MQILRLNVFIYNHLQMDIYVFHFLPHVLAQHLDAFIKSIRIKYEINIPFVHSILKYLSHIYVLQHCKSMKRGLHYFQSIKSSFSNFHFRIPSLKRATNTCSSSIGPVCFTPNGLQNLPRPHGFSIAADFIRRF